MSQEAKRDAKKAWMHRVHVVEEIFRDWDPLGVMPGRMAPEDEYDSYASTVVSMCAKGSDVYEVCEHLGQLRTRIMLCEPDRTSDWKAARKIVHAVSSGGTDG